MLQLCVPLQVCCKPRGQDCYAYLTERQTEARTACKIAHAGIALRSKRLQTIGCFSFFPTATQAREFDSVSPGKREQAPLSKPKRVLPQCMGSQKPKPSNLGPSLGSPRPLGFLSSGQAKLTCGREGWTHTRLPLTVASLLAWLGL